MIFRVDFNTSNITRVTKEQILELGRLYFWFDADEKISIRELGSILCGKIESDDYCYCPTIKEARRVAKEVQEYKRKQNR